MATGKVAEKLAIDGGEPVRTKPFGPRWIFGEEEKRHLAEVIDDASEPADTPNSQRWRSRFKVKAFCEAFAVRHGAHYAVPTNSATAAIHTAIAAINPEPGDEVITAWIALDDVDELNGCLRYIDGSHRGPILEHLPLPDEPYNLSPAQENIDLNREALAPVGKGGVVFHHSKMLHTSHRNESDRWRRAYATHWASAEVTSENETIDEAYYNANADIYEAATQALTTT